MQQWEYMYITLRHTWVREEKIAGESAYHIHQIEAILNVLGSQGWEVIGSTQTASGTGKQNYPRFTLKRPSPSRADRSGL